MRVPTIIEWVRKLEAQIEEQKRYAEPYELRYRNEYILPFIASEYRDVYGTRADHLLASVLEAPRAGSAGIVVDALVERLTVLGGSSEDKDTARAIEAAWDDNAMDVMHREAHRDTLIRSRSFGAISRSTDGRAIQTIESSEQAAVHRMQGPPYDVDAYLKIWVDEWTGKRKSLLQLLGRDVYLNEGDMEVLDPEGSGLSSRWSVDREAARRDMPWVPVVEFPHTSRLLAPPHSEIEPVITLVDEVDLVEGLMVFAGHFGAVPIRWASGLEVPRDPANPALPLLGPDGKPMVGFKPRADHFWSNSNPEGKFGQLTPATLDTFIAWAEHASGRLRSKTRIASSYFTLNVKSHMSAELLKVDEAPMIRRVNGMGRDGNLNHAWRRYLTLTALTEGHKGRVNARWGDPQTRMEAQAVDAFQKAVASRLGRKIAAEQFLGWSPELAERAIAEADADAAAQEDQFSLLDPATRAALKVPSADPEPAASA